MTITVNTPDGGTAQFPDDTPQDKIVSAMKAKFGGPDNSAGQFKPGFADQLVGAATLHAPDYLEAGGNWLAREAGINKNAPDLAQIRERNAQYGQEHPILATTADMLGYAWGPGKLGIGEKLAAGAAARGLGPRLAGAVGSAGEAGIATAAGDVSLGETPGSDVVTNMGVGGALGAAIGNRGRALGPALGRAAGKVGTKAADTDVLGPVAKDFLGPEVPPPRALGESVLKANMDDAYTKLEGIAVKPPTVGNALQRTLGSLTPGERAGISDTLQGRISKISDIIDNSPRLTLGDIHAFGTEISTGMRSPVDSKVGAKIAETFNRLDPRGLMEDARMKYGQFQDAQTLNKGLDASKWYKGANAADTIATAAERTAPDARTKFSPAGREAMAALGNAGPNEFGKMADYLLAKGGNKAVAAGIGALGAGPFGHAALGALAGASGVGPGGIGGYLARLRTNAAARRAMKAALAATSTGQRATADMFRGAPWYSQAARQALYARGASGDSGD